MKYRVKLYSKQNKIYDDEFEGSSLENINFWIAVISDEIKKQTNHENLHYKIIKNEKKYFNN